MKQPRYFFKSMPDKHHVSVAVAAEDPGEKEVELPEIELRHRFPIFSRAMFGVGAAAILGLFSLAFLPGVLKNHPLPLVSSSPSNVPVLTQKGGIGLEKGLQFDAKVSDGRVAIVAGFLTRYNSPLKPAEKYAGELVAAAERYNLDYRLLPAIMMQESNLCKTSDPALHNCLGFGIHSRGTLGFDTYEEGFDRAARELKQNYIDEGLTTPNQIMTKYTPSSNGSWANSVNQWIAEMEYNNRTMGLNSDQDMDLTAYSRGK